MTRRTPKPQKAAVPKRKRVESLPPHIQRCLATTLEWPRTAMRVVASDQNTGRKYRCSCGWIGWTVWGRARKHHDSCEVARAKA